jgi:hypothetical protein
VVTTVDVASSPPVPSSVEVSIPSPNPNGIDISDVVVSPGNRGGHPVDGAVLATPGVVPAFPATTPSVCVFWTVHRMPHGASNGMLWTRDGTVVRPLADATFAWQGGGSATPNWCFPATPVGIPPGRHRVEYFISGVSQFVVEFVIGA